MRGRCEGGCEVGDAVSITSISTDSRTAQGVACRRRLFIEEHVGTQVQALRKKERQQSSAC